MTKSCCTPCIPNDKNFRPKIKIYLKSFAKKEERIRTYDRPVKGTLTFDQTDQRSVNDNQQKDKTSDQGRGSETPNLVSRPE